MTKELLDAFKKQGYTDGKPKDQVKVIAKYFNPVGRGTWYAVEFNEEDRCFFGYCTGLDYDELGYFSLDEFESLRLPMGLGIERDLHFGMEHTLKEIMDKSDNY